jgi:hypothetical protein
MQFFGTQQIENDVAKTNTIILFFKKFPRRCSISMYGIVIDRILKENYEIGIILIDNNHNQKL